MMLIVLANIYGTLVTNMMFQMGCYFVQLSQPSRRQASCSRSAGSGPPSPPPPPSPLTSQSGESPHLLQSLLKYHLFSGDFANCALKISTGSALAGEAQLLAALSLTWK